MLSEGPAARTAASEASVAPAVEWQHNYAAAMALDLAGISVYGIVSMIMSLLGSVLILVIFFSNPKLDTFW